MGQGPSAKELHKALRRLDYEVRHAKTKQRHYSVFVLLLPSNGNAHRSLLLASNNDETVLAGSQFEVGSRGQLRETAARFSDSVPYLNPSFRVVREHNYEALYVILDEMNTEEHAPDLREVLGLGAEWHFFKSNDQATADVIIDDSVPRQMPQTRASLKRWIRSKGRGPKGEAALA